MLPKSNLIFLAHENSFSAWFKAGTMMMLKCWPMIRTNPLYGTLRYLAILSALITEEPDSMIVIEEVDNGIHPSRIKSLIQTISRLTKERQIDVIITTHNPTLLNALSKEELFGVGLCYRDIEILRTDRVNSIPCRTWNSYRLFCQKVI